MPRSNRNSRNTIKPGFAHRATITEKDFDTTMLEVTHAMPRQRRFFSKFIHRDIISAASDAIGNTVARPTPILFGSISMFSLTLLAYLLSKNLGYSLSGSEPIIAFLIGWVIGIITDMLNHFFDKQ